MKSQTTDIAHYWTIGQQIILEEQNGNKRAPHGTQLMDRLSAEYTKKFGRAYTPFNMFYMRRLYLFFSIPETLVNNRLTWSHYVEALRTNNEHEAKFYITQAIKDRWSSRQLRQQIKNKLYYHVAITAHYLNHETHHADAGRT